MFKKYILPIILWILLIPSFSNAVSLIDYNWYALRYFTGWTLWDFDLNWLWYQQYWILITQILWKDYCISIEDSWTYKFSSNYETQFSNWIWRLYCISKDAYSYLKSWWNPVVYIQKVNSTIDPTKPIKVYYLDNSWWWCPECEQCEQCEDCTTYQTQLNSCQNQLETCNVWYNSCLESLENCSSETECDECPTCEWSWAEIFINNTPYWQVSRWIIQIPNFIWFETEQNWWLLNLNIDWYDQDLEQMQSKITTQYEIPNENDFANSLMSITNLLPWLWFLLLFIFIFYLFKKLF